jgi:hypothetical protein
MATAQRVDARNPQPRTMPGRGNFWVQPVAVAIAFTLFVVYSFYSVAIYVAHHSAGPYLSPYYSPVIHPGWWFLSPAFLVAWVPLGFRGTCYYTHGFYIGLGSIIMLTNVVLITGYTLSCHALRHLVGGSVDCFSCSRAGKARHGAWGFVSKLNPYHPSWAWFSLTSVAAADLYIRIVSNVGNCFGVHTGC